MKIRKKLIRKNVDGFIYSVEVQERKQSDLQNPIRKLENDMAFLQEKLTIKTDKKGQLLKIQNLTEIRNKWQKSKNKLYAKHKSIKPIDIIFEQNDVLLSNEEAFSKNFEESEICTLLFPPIYFDNYQKYKPIKQKKSFSNFFWKHNLPIDIETTLKEYNITSEEADISRKGYLDSESFEAEEVQEMFRKTYDKYKLKAKVDLDYMENYSLSKYHWIDFANQIFGVKVKGLYSFQQITQLTPLK